MALLLGDYLYAHGLVRIAATGDLDAVAALAELISTCAAPPRRAGEPATGRPGSTRVRAARRRSAAGAVEQALAAHAERLVKLAP